jgi:hypothetical protein
MKIYKYILISICFLIMAFTTINKFIIVKNVKYNYIKTKYSIDTIQSGYGDLTIVKKQTIYYNHFKN